MSRKGGDASKKKAETFQGLEGIVHEFPGPVRDAAIRLLYSFESDTLPTREDLALVLVHLVDRERERGKTLKKVRKVVRTEPRKELRPQQGESNPRDDVPVRSAFHERIQEGSALPEGPVSRLLRRRLGVSSDGSGRRRTDDGE